MHRRYRSSASCSSRSRGPGVLRYEGVWATVDGRLPWNRQQSVSVALSVMLEHRPPLGLMTKSSDLMSLGLAGSLWG